MIINMSAKSLTFLLALGVASTTGSANLRQRRASIFNHDHSHGDDELVASVEAKKPSAKSSNLRASNADKDEEIAAINAEAAAAQQQSASSSSATLTKPSIALSKSTYGESEPISVSFSVGSPAHPYYSSSDAPSLNLDYNYPQWSIGLFMRDADPQGGTLSPIVSINVCGAVNSLDDRECDTHDRKSTSYNELSVTFSDENTNLMSGTWPLEVCNYGTGFDAYVLDANGAAAIGPLEFYIDDEADDDEDGALEYNAASLSSSSSSRASSSTSPVTKKNYGNKSGLMKYNKGYKKASERQHAAVSISTKYVAAKANMKISEGNGIEMSSVAVPESSSIHQVSQEETTGPKEGSITSNKDKYEDDESVSINFTLQDSASTQDMSNYKIGIFMRMAHPQGGALDPVVSLPLCSSGSSCSSAEGVTSGSVTFSSETFDMMEGGSWPIDLYEWGTGFDAYVLNEEGDDVVGPVKFNIMMGDTY